MLITVTAASGVGKTTMFRRAMAEFPNLKMLRSFTTRESRDSDLPGEYEIVSKDEFRARLLRSEFAWNQEYAGFLYGTRRDDVKEALESRDPYLAAIIPIRIPSIHDLAHSFGLAGRLQSIFIFAPGLSVLRKRMLERGEKPESIDARIKTCESWNVDARKERRYNGFIADRDDLDEKYAALKRYIHSSIR